MSSTDASETLIGDALHDGEERFKLLLDTLPHMAFAVFTGGTAEHYNQAFLDYHGFIPGTDHGARAGLLHPDDRPLLTEARAAATPLDRDYVVEVRLRRHDGAYRWHRLHNKPLIRETRRIGYLGTAVDIHDSRLANEALEERVRERTAELRASEARYRTLYNRTPMALQSVDASACLIDVNDTWTELFGFAREAVIGRSPAEFMTPESALVYRQQAWPAMLASEGQMLATEYQFVACDGRVFDGRLASRGEFDPAGQFVRSWSVIADVTGEKRAGRELRQVQRMEAVGQLTAGIAHDFNNLLTAILGNLELLARRPLQADPKAVRLIEGAKSAAERGARLTGQLLAFSRQQRIAAEPLDLGRLVEGMRQLLRSTIGATIKIDIKSEPGLWIALADPTQFELAVLNLAINARDAMPQGGVLTISSGNVRRGMPARLEEPEPGDYVQVVVCDTGSGISDAARERIFEPFFTTKEIGKGSGLGLPQVLGVVKQLGGGIAVRSVPGQGTCIALFLKRAEAAVAAEAAPAERSAEVRPERVLQVLVVDDDPAVRGVAAEMLRDAGHAVEEVGSGAAALDRMRQTRTDILVADVAMPGMSGIELAASARQSWPGLPVLFMTGFAEERMLPGPGEAVIRKPFTADAFAARVALVAKPSENPASAP